MTAATASTSLVPVRFSGPCPAGVHDAGRLALAACRGLTREACALDLLHAGFPRKFRRSGPKTASPRKNYAPQAQRPGKLKPSY